MAANSTSYDLIADLLSTNNTISVATLIGTFLFGVLAIYGCLLTWRYQQWQRQMLHGAVVNARDDLEAGPHAEENEMRDFGSTSNEGTAVERSPDSTYADSISSSSQLGSSTLTAEGNTSNEETAAEENPDGTYVDSISGSQLGASTLTVEGDITRSIGTEASISSEVGNIHMRIGDLDRPQSSEHVYDSGGGVAH